MVDRRATVPPIVKLYIYCTEKVALHLSIYLLCQVKTHDEKNNRHVYLLGKIQTNLYFTFISHLPTLDWLDFMVRKFWGSVYRWITLNDFYQEAHGPHPFPEKQFQSNKHIFAKLCLYHNFDWENKYYLLIENWMHLICKTLNPLYPRMLCAKFGWNWPSGSVEKW